MIEMSNALYIWSCLDRAKAGKAPHNSNTIEVFADRLLPNEYYVTVKEDPWALASENLALLLDKYCETNNVIAFVNGHNAKEWLGNNKIYDYCEVRIEKTK